MASASTGTPSVQALMGTPAVAVMDIGRSMHVDRRDGHRMRAIFG
jgi:hypothetical protein